MHAEEAGTCLQRPRIPSNEGCLLIAAFVRALPGMILLTVAGLFDRSVASYECFIRCLFKTDDGPVDKKQLDTRIRNVARRRGRAARADLVCVLLYNELLQARNLRQHRDADD
jgi:hypothetical protein